MADKLTKIEIAPQLVADDTPLASEGAWTSLQWVRHRRGRLEVQPGWERLHPSETFTGIVRGAHAWADLSGGPVLAYGTESKLYAYTGGSTDITPYHSEVFLDGPFTTVNTSTTVTVTNKIWDSDTATSSTVPHNLQVGDIVLFERAVAVGGITISGTYTVQTIPTDTTYTITHGSAASSGATGGGYVYTRVTLRDGLVDGTGGLGYGSGTYGDGDYSLPNTVDYLPRVWSLDNFGENLVAIPRDGGVYEYQPALVTPNLITASSSWANGTDWGSTGTTAQAPASTGVASNTSLALALSAGKVYRISFTLARTSGSGAVTVKIDSIAVSPPLTVAGTYSFVFQAPPTPSQLVISKDTAWAGSLTSLSLTIAATAYRIDEAPVRNSMGFVDPNGIVVVGGTIDLTGAFDPLGGRTSALRNMRSWVPDTANVASYFRLALGGRIVGGLPTRQQNLIWTDTAVYSQQYTGTAGNPYNYRLLGTGCGLIGLNAAGEHNGIVLWMSNARQFYIFQGAVPQVLDCPVRDEIFDNLDMAQAEKVYCYINSSHSEAVWLLPDSRTGTECSREVRYNWIENHWYVGTIARSAGVSPGVFETPILFGTDNVAYIHEYGETFAGGALSWSSETAAFDIADGDKFAAITGYQPDFKSLQGTITTTFYGRNASQDAWRVVGTGTITSSTRRIAIRAMARQMKIKFEGTGTPCTARFGAQLFWVQETGARR